MSTQTHLFPLPIDYPFSFQTQIPVLVEHINYGNHLGHDSLISLLHEARVRFLLTHGISEKSLIMTELFIQYRSESFYKDLLSFEIAAMQQSPIRIVFLYRVKEASSGRLVAEASTTLAFYDYEKNKVIKPPASFVETLKNKKT